MTPQGRYEELARALTARAGVIQSTGRRGFGSSGQLKADGRIFAMLVDGTLVLKLPGMRVDTLVAEGAGKRFDAGKGRPMGEWFVLAPGSSRRWLPLAEEALRFALARPRENARRT